MNLPYHRVFNFSAGPGALPIPVLEQARDQMLDYNGSGMSVMELSHRGPHFEPILERAIGDLKALMGISDEYEVLFLQGGASTQFSMFPLSFLPSGGSADYVITGSWGQKAVEAAKMVGTVNVVYDGKSNNYNRVEPIENLSPTPGAAYLHFTTNETIHGVQYPGDPAFSGALVCDMSSDILSRPCDVSRYDVIYAGAQKNMGPAGATVVILKKSFLERAPEKTHPMFDYRLQVANGSMYNTPPCWSIYICGLVYQWLLQNGGLKAMQALNERKAKLIYDAIDASGGFYRGHSVPEHRSRMNITFVLANDDLSGTFLKEATAGGLDGLKGHRSVGGMRASVYNAFPEEGCRALADFMRDFACRNG